MIKFVNYDLKNDNMMMNYFIYVFFDMFLICKSNNIFVVLYI